MTGLQPETQALLRDYAAARTPGAEAIERAWGVVQARVAEGAPTMALDEDRPAVRMVSLRAVVIGLAIAAAIVLALRFVPSTMELEEAPREVEAPFVTPGGEPSQAVEASTPREPTAAPLDTAPSTAIAVDPEASERPQRPAKSPTNDAGKPRPALGLKEETALLREGEAALAAGDAKAALAAFDRHAREFPRGQLVPERMYKRAVALCELGRTKAAKKAVDAFLRAYPGSPLRARVEAVCDEP